MDGDLVAGPCHGALTDFGFGVFQSVRHFDLLIGCDGSPSPRRDDGDCGQRHSGAGTSDESNTIRIGTNGTQKKTFIAGISGTTVSGADVVVSSTGQLGIATSSARYKRDIHDMGGASAGLMKLRPVSFRYKDDPSGTLQYGLVAEEVARVYPELVTRGTDGKLQSVRYLELTALLLNELQKQATKLAAQQREIDTLKQQNASINALSERLVTLERQVRMVNPDGLGSLARK